MAGRLFRVLMGTLLFLGPVIRAVEQGASFPATLALFSPPGSWLRVGLAATLALGLRVAVGGSMYRYWPAYRQYLDQVHDPELRARLRAPIHALSMLVVVAAGGAMEEVLYRGFLQPYCGLLWTSLLFGVAHALEPGNSDERRWAQVIPPFLSGLVYGGCLLSFGSLWPGLIAHAGGNAIAVMQQWRAARRESAVEL